MSRHLRAPAGSMPCFASGSGVGQQHDERAAAAAAGLAASVETGLAAISVAGAFSGLLVSCISAGGIMVPQARSAA